MGGRRPRKAEPAGDYGLQALIAVRAPFFLGYRLAVRLFQLLSPDGGATTPGWRVALAIFVVIDICQWKALRRSDRCHLGTRLAVDSVDIAVWTLAPYPPGTSDNAAVWIGVPIALEAGVRFGWAGVVVPGTALVVTLAVHRVVPRQLTPVSFVWLVLTVGCGVLLARYIGRLEDQSRAEFAQRRTAALRRARLAGQNSVAMGSSSVVDALEAVLPALGPPEPGSVLWTIADAWKLQLSEATSGSAVYLGQALAEWAAEHNRHPDLSGHVVVSAPEGVGTVLLTARQEDALRQLLNQSGLRGTVVVELLDPSVPDRPPGGPLRLRVGTDIAELPGDPGRPPRRFDPAPAGFLIAVLLMGADVIAMPLRPPLVAPAIAMSLLAAWWADRRLRRLGPSARPAVLLAAVIVAATYTALATAALLSPKNPGGLENYPVVVGLDLLLLLAGMYWRALDSTMRVVPVVAAALLLGLTWSLHPLADHPGHLLLTACWTLPILVGGLCLGRELDARAAAYQRELIAQQAKDEAAAFQRGQRVVLDLVGEAAKEARLRLASLKGTLTAADARLLQERLGEIDRRLKAVAPCGGWSSSTTTS